ncbi:MAG: glycosyltransferase, partial [Chitinophagaceae bacterium]|nr:glycosyltransferase [Chitinophagaceae bacterium]
MKLSICVPTYNRLKSLLLLLESLKKISYDPGSYEILISDDSTNNETRDYFATHSFPNITYYKNFTNLGQFRNCSACVSRAKGEWVQIVHDDDEINPAYLESIAPLFEQKDAVIIAGKTIILGEQSEETVKKHQAKLDKIGFTGPVSVDGKELILKILLHGNPFIFSHTIFRREIALSHGSFNNELRYVGDINLWLRILSSGKCYFSNTVMGNYLIHDANSLIGVGEWNLYTEFLCEKISYANHIKQHCSAQEYATYIHDISKEIPQALFVAENILKRKELHIRLTDL